MRLSLPVSLCCTQALYKKQNTEHHLALPSWAAPDGPSADLAWEAFGRGFLCVGKAAVPTLRAGPPRRAPRLPHLERACPQEGLAHVAKQKHTFKAGGGCTVMRAQKLMTEAQVTAHIVPLTSLPSA